MTQPSLLQPRVLIPFAVCTLIWGSTWIVIRDQLGVVPPTWSVAYRFLIAGVAMLAYAVATRVPLRMAPRDLAFSAAAGTAVFVFNFNFVYRAEAFITSGLVAVVFALLIVPNAILGRIFLKRAITARFLTGSAVALGGVAMLIVHEVRAEPASADTTWVGVSLVLLGVLAASVSNVVQASERARALPMATMLGYGMLWGAALNAAIALATVGPPVIDTRPGYLLGLFYLGVFASAIAFTTYFNVIRAVGPSVAAYSGVLTPIIAMILSTIFEDYRWSWLAAGGGVVALAGLAIALSPPRKSG